MEIKPVQIERLTVGENSRAGGNQELDTLAHNILLIGIQQPLALRKVGKDLRVLSGHRRLAASIIAQKMNPNRFKELHPKGIPCFVREDVITDVDEARVKVDHATQLSLTLRCELYKSVKICLDAGMTEAEIAEHLEGLFAQLSRSIPSKVRDQIKALRAEKVVDKAAIRKLLLATYKGQIQTLKRIYACPPQVAAALEYAETGTMPEGFDKLPEHIRTKHVPVLLKAFQDDIEVDPETGTVEYSKAEPGPAFRKAWDDVIKDKPVDDGKTRLKGMSSKALLEQVQAGTYASKGMQKLTSKHAGIDGVKGIEAADVMLHLCELVKKYRPAVYKAFEAEGIEVKKEIANGTA